MKKKKLIIFLVAGFILLIFLLIKFNPFMLYRNYQLKEALRALSHHAGTLEEEIPFDWDYIYRLQPYESKEDMEKTMGVSSIYIEEADYDEMTVLYVIKGGKVIAYINGRMDNQIENTVSRMVPEVLKYGDNYKFEKTTDKVKLSDNDNSVQKSASIKQKMEKGIFQ